MNEDTIRIVTREETFTDLAVRELAKNRAACLCRIQFGRCKRSECANCATGKRFQSCIASMNDYDRLRLQSYTADEYTYLSAKPSNWRSHQSYMLHYIGTVLAFLLMFAAVIFIPTLVCGPFDKPSSWSISDTYRSKIVNTMTTSQMCVTDFDKDGKINCIDYTISFKLTWDKFYPDLKHKCTIIRNVNPRSGMNHLFIKVGDQFVEPWSYNINKYTMEDNWWNGSYDPRYNIYGETQRWLNEVR